MIFFLKSFLADTCPFLGHWCPCFDFSGDISSGFQSQSGFCLIQIFGATHPNLLVASHAASHFSICMIQVQIQDLCKGEPSEILLTSCSRVAVAAKIWASNLGVKGPGPPRSAPCCISRGGAWLRFKWAITHTEDERFTIVPATWLRL